MRLCPTVDGSASPLITHRIGSDVCLARQASNFHKCHRCIYRGQAANWEPPGGPPPMLDVLLDAEPNLGRPVEIPRPAPRIAAPKKKKSPAAVGKNGSAGA